jgi:nicotinamidase-related amidase
MAEQRKALLIVNMLRDFIDPGAPMEVQGARDIIDSIAGEIRYAREKGRPIIFLCDRHEVDDPEFELWPAHAVRDTPGAEVVEALAPQPGDFVIEKSSYSGFFHTELDVLLDELDIDDLLICGVPTNVGVLYTAVDAMMRGIGVIAPETCVAASNADDHRFALRQINEVLGNPATSDWKKGE